MAAELCGLTSEIAFGKCIHDQADCKRTCPFSILSFQANPSALIQRSIQYRPNARLSPKPPEIGNSLSQPSWRLAFMKEGSQQDGLRGGAGRRQTPSITVLGICRSWKPLWGRVQRICMMRSSMWKPRRRKICLGISKRMSNLPSGPSLRAVG